MLPKYSRSNGGGILMNKKRYLIDIYMNNSEVVDGFWKMGEEDAVKHWQKNTPVSKEYFIFNYPTWDRSEDYNVPTLLEVKQSAYSLGFHNEWEKMQEWEKEKGQNQ